MKAQASSGSDPEVRLLAWLATCVSVFSFLFYYRHGDVLLYGDAVAHVNIARRVFDSKTPGLLQLGTVWLPLPHLLMIPFLLSNEMWRYGAGGSIPSMAAYVFGIIGIFRLVRGVLAGDGGSDGAARVAAWGASIVYGSNPNLIYLQSTAMTETLYLALFVWAVVYFSDFVLGDTKALVKCGLCVTAACLTRYDGWVLAGVMAVFAIVIASRNFGDHRLRNAVIKFVLLAVAAPVLWLVYNAAVYRNALEFANGPYSARAIATKTATVNPADGSVRAGATYFLKSGEINVAETTLLQRLWLLLAGLGLAVMLIRGSRMWLALLLAVPVPFYAVSLAYGAVPIFIPVWWPFSHYNVRYGLQLMPALVVFGAIGVAFLGQILLPKFLKDSAIKSSKWLKASPALAVLVLVLVSYAGIWQAQPVCYREAVINSHGRQTLEKQVADWLKLLPSNSTILMYLGEHVGAVQRADIPLRRVINEGNHRVWKQPVDTEGLWERALADPAALADYVVAFDGDPVWKAVQGHSLPELVEIQTTGQPRAVIYRTRPAAVITRVNATDGTNRESAGCGDKIQPLGMFSLTVPIGR